MPNHINIETNFFEDGESRSSSNQQRDQSILMFQLEKSAIIIENTLESAKLRRMIWAFRMLRKDLSSSRISRKYSSGKVLVPHTNQRVAGRFNTDSDNPGNSRQIKSKSQSRVLTRKQSQPFDRINRSEMKASRRVILEGIRDKLQSHSINKSAQKAKKIAIKNSIKKQVESTKQLDRRIRKLETLVRNIRQDKQLNEPAIVYQRKMVEKMPKKEPRSDNFKIFIEQIQKLREEVSELKQLNETLIRSSRAKSMMPTPRESRIYTAQHSSQHKRQEITQNFHSVFIPSDQPNIQIKSEVGSNIKSRSPKTFSQYNKQNSRKQNNQQHQHPQQQPENSYQILINVLRSPKIPKQQEMSRFKNSLHQQNEVSSQKYEQNFIGHIDYVEQILTKRKNNQIQPENKQFLVAENKKNNQQDKTTNFVKEKEQIDNWKEIQTRVLGTYYQSKDKQKQYTSYQYQEESRKYISDHDKYLEKDRSVFNYKDLTGYSGNYTPSQGGYTNPELFKRLGFSVESNNTLKSLDIIKNTTSEPYPEKSQKNSLDVSEKPELQKNTLDELHTYKSSSLGYSQQTLNQPPEKLVINFTKYSPASYSLKSQQRIFEKPHQSRQKIEKPQSSQLESYTRSHSSIPIGSNTNNNSNRNMVQFVASGNVQYHHVSTNSYQPSYLPKINPQPAYSYNRSVFRY